MKRPRSDGTLRVLAISGSLRSASHNTTLLREAARLAPDGVTVDLMSRDELFAVPPYVDELDTESPPPAVAVVRSRIATADALLFATPEYNGSVPGQLKNVVDWASRPRGEAPLLNADVAVVSASTGMFGGLWAADDLRKVLKIAGARVVDAGLSLPQAATAFDEHGSLVEHEHAAQLRAVLEALVTEAATSAGTVVATAS